MVRSATPLETVVVSPSYYGLLDAGTASMPQTLTRDQVRAAGAQVIIVTNSCGVGSPTAWQGETFNWSSQHLETQPRTYSDYPTCGADFTRYLKNR